MQKARKGLVLSTKLCTAFKMYPLLDHLCCNNYLWYYLDCNKIYSDDIDTSNIAIYDDKNWSYDIFLTVASLSTYRLPLYWFSYIQKGLYTTYEANVRNILTSQRTY